MRRRLMLAMVGLVAVVLVIAGAGSLILTRNAARNQAESQLVSEVELAHVVQERVGVAQVLRVVRKTLKLEDADVIQIDRAGQRGHAAARGADGTGHRRGRGAVGPDDVGTQGQHSSTRWRR